MITNMDGTPPKLGETTMVALRVWLFTILLKKNLCRTFTSMTDHRAGFVTILGKPNVGKSTLLNALTGFKIAAISPKASTTRHHIMGFVSSDNYQVVFLDTPGVIKESYKLHEKMMESVTGSLKSGDAVLLLFSPDNTNEDIADLTRMAADTKLPVIAVMNKVDKAKPEEIQRVKAAMRTVIPEGDLFVISALEKIYLNELVNEIVKCLPVHPAYYDKDDLTDRNMRFIASEIIREQLYNHLAEELPYVSTVLIKNYKEKEDITVIEAEIIVERESQKVIVIGKQGTLVKKIGMEARKTLEKVLEQKVFLDLHVKVVPNWRDNDQLLDQFGYTSPS